MSRVTLQTLGLMAALLAAAAAWRWWHAPVVDMEAPVATGLYHHKTPEPPARKGDDESFHYVRGERVQLAPEKATLEDLTPELQRRLGIAVSTATPKGRRGKPVISPAVEALLEMLPPQRGTPHVQGKPQLIPQTTAPGGAPLEQGATAQPPAPSP